MPSWRCLGLGWSDARTSVFRGWLWMIDRPSRSSLSQLPRLGHFLRPRLRLACGVWCGMRIDREPSFRSIKQMAQARTCAAEHHDVTAPDFFHPGVPGFRLLHSQTATPSHSAEAACGEAPTESTCFPHFSSTPQDERAPHLPPPSHGWRVVLQVRFFNANNSQQQRKHEKKTARKEHNTPAGITQLRNTRHSLLYYKITQTSLGNFIDSFSGE